MEDMINLEILKESMKITFQKTRKITKYAKKEKSQKTKILKKPKPGKTKKIKLEPKVIDKKRERRCRRKT